MSYILTALRKAEQQRKTAVSDGFLAISQVEDSVSSSVWKNLVIAILAVLLAACVVYLVATRLNSGDSAAAVPVQIQPMATGTALPAGNSALESKDAETIEPAAPAVSTWKEAAPLPAPAPVAKLDDGADGRQEPLPALNITGYIFFEESPERSKLFIDGIVYRQGSRLAQGLTLTGFAKNHITVSFHGAAHTIPVN